jgi:hypothetical protein
VAYGGADMIEQINYLKQEYPRTPATLIHQKLIDNGTITKNDISLLLIIVIQSNGFYSGILPI